MCDDATVDIYVDGNYLGNGGPLKYVVPAGVKNVNVDCYVNGEVVFTRKYNVEGQKNVLFDIRIPKNYQYHTK